MIERNALLQVEELYKSYGEKKVVDGVGFVVERGDIIGVLGPNGAGKTTTIRMITGVEGISQGRIFFEGKEQTRNNRKMLQQIGVVPQDIAVYSDMNAYDNVDFFCSLYGYGKKERRKRVQEALEFVGLWEHRKERPDQFSGGMKRRLNIACSITNDPELLIMDEPTVGIDPQSRNHIMDTIRTLHQRGTAILYVSHYMEEIEALCNRILLLDHGRVLADEGKEQFMNKYQETSEDSLEEIFLRLTGTALRDQEQEEAYGTVLWIVKEESQEEDDRRVCVWI